MSSRKLYIDGRIIDLAPDEPIPLTFQVNDIAELSDRQANFSTTFTIPKSNNNRIALNFSDIVASNTNAPYRKIPSDYFQSGIPLIQNGQAIIEESGENFDITLYSGIYDFFAQLGELTLKDIDWSSYNHLYDVPTIISINSAYLSGSSNVCMPLIQWGAYLTNDKIDIKYQCFALRFSDIINKIFSKTTYTAEGQILNDGIYQDMALTLSPDQQEPEPSVLSSRSGDLFTSGANDAGVTITNGPNIANALALFSIGSISPYLIRDNINPKVISWPANWIPPQVLNTTRYRSNYFGTIKVYAKLVFSTINLNGVETYRIFKNNIQINQQPIGDYPDHAGFTTNVAFEDEFTIDVKPGDDIKISFYAINWQLVNSSSSDSSIITIENISTIPLGSEVNYNYIAPNLKLKDIIRSFCQQFGLIITSSNDKIIFTKFGEISNNIQQSEDWSNKIDISQPIVINYRIGNYAQNNIFRWLSSDQTNTFGDSSFSINDQVLEKESELLQMIYPSAIPYENIRSTSYRFKPLPLDDYYTTPPHQYLHEYFVGNQVGRGNVIFVCLQYISGLVNIDVTNPTYWQIRSDQYLTNQKNEGVEIPRFTKIDADTWQSNESYFIGDIVNYHGTIYLSLIDDNQNNIPGPSNLDKWEKRTFQFEQTISSDSRLVLIRPITRIPNVIISDAGSYVNSLGVTDGVNIAGSDTGSYPMAYWSDNLEAYNLTGQYLLGKYYPELIRMLQNLKVVSVYMRLTEVDINKLDFLKLKYVKYFGNYFYLNKVEDYIEGQSCRVELIRM